MQSVTKKSSELFCSVTDLLLEDLDQEQMDKIHFRTFCSIAIALKIDLTLMTNHESYLIDQAMDGDKWISHAVTQGILYHA
jgi:hypothetical protein